MTDLEVAIIAYNEDANIQRCLDSLKELHISNVTLYDSGSNDRTLEIAKQYGVRIVKYDYIDHCKTYNDLTQRNKSYLMILDADMQVTGELLAEVRRRLRNDNVEIIKAPVQMNFFGNQLRFASLYPPKPFVFKGGKVYFSRVGHGEAIVGKINQVKTRHKLIHDDRKSIQRFANTQVSYARKLIKQKEKGKLRFKDKLKLNTPIMMAAMFVKSYILKGGFMDGKAGFGYALERILACGIQLRESIIYRLSSESEDSK